MIEPFVVPHFDNETDEANWWYDHRADIERLFDQHAAAGTLRWTTSRTSSAVELPLHLRTTPSPR